MNCETIKQKIGIRAVLESFSLFPAKENRQTAFYFALDRKEKTPSFSISIFFEYLVSFIRQTELEFFEIKM